MMKMMVMIMLMFSLAMIVIYYVDMPMLIITPIVPIEKMIRQI